MTLKIKISPTAVKDIQTGVDYYNGKQKGLGRKFEHTVADTFNQIRDMPQAASFAYDTVRYKIVDKFPYIITFELDNKHIIIHRVFNTYLNPDTL